MARMRQAAERAKLSSRVLYIVPLAALVRLLYLTEHARSPLFQFPVLDALYYDTVARLLAQGESVISINPGFRPLLYPWLLSRLYLIAPQSAIPLALATQHLLGVAIVALTIWIAHRVSRSSVVAATAGMLLLCSGPPLYFEGEVLLTTLATLLNLLLVAFLVWFLADESVVVVDRRAILCWLVAGALLGLAAQTRPNVLLFVAALPLGALYLARRAGVADTRRRAWAALASALAGLLLVLTLFGALQRPAFGRFQLLTGSGGVNFYLGNKRQADGMIPRQDRAVTYAGSYRDSVQVFARQEYARAKGLPSDQPNSSEISRYWLGAGFREIAAAPLSWLGLMARKSWFLAWNREIPNNRSYGWVLANESIVLRWLPVRWWLLVTLTPFGVAALWRRGRRRALFWLTSFIICWSAGLLLFFVNSRYRAPLWPLLCVLAAAGGVGAVEAVTRALRQRRPGSLIAPALAGIALAALSLVNWLNIPEPTGATDFFYRSVANLELGRLEAAREDAEAAVAADGGEASHHFQLASVSLAEDRPRRAIESLREAARLKPDEPRIWNNLGVALERLGEPSAAYASYKKAIEVTEDYAPALANAALLELRAGLVDAAAARLAVTESLQDPSVHLLCARAFLARASGRLGDAELLLARARAVEPEVVRRLDEESRKPLTLVPE